MTTSPAPSGESSEEIDVPKLIQRLRSARLLVAAQRPDGIGPRHWTDDVCADIENARIALSSTLNRTERGEPVVTDGYILPCDVRLPPATTIAKGCKLSTLLVALAQRHGHEGWATAFAPPPPEAKDLDGKGEAVGGRGHSNWLRQRAAMLSDNRHEPAHTFAEIADWIDAEPSRHPPEPGAGKIREAATRVVRIARGLANVPLTDDNIIGVGGAALRELEAALAASPEPREGARLSAEGGEPRHLTREEQQSFKKALRRSATVTPTAPTDEVRRLREALGVLRALSRSGAELDIIDAALVPVQEGK